MQTLQEVIREACDGEAASFRESYSGRGMYGRSCIGIVGSLQACMKVVTTVMADTATDVLGIIESQLADGADPGLFDDNRMAEYADALSKVETDSMGYNIIMYWPELAPIPESEEDSEQVD